MATKGSSDIGKVLLGLGGVVVLAWLLNGQGKQNSLLVPDSIENRLDSVVETLNRRFGKKWVNFGLDALQGYLQRMLPGTAALLNTIFWIEQNHPDLTGDKKKQLALGAL